MSSLALGANEDCVGDDTLSCGLPSSLRSVQLSVGCFSDAGVAALCANSPFITDLTLSQNAKLTTWGVELACRKLCALTKLVVSFNPQLAFSSPLPFTTTLRELGLAALDLDDATVLATIDKVPYIEELNVSHNTRLTGDILIPLAWRSDALKELVITNTPNISAIDVDAFKMMTTRSVKVVK